MDEENPPPPAAPAAPAAPPQSPDQAAEHRTPASDPAAAVNTTDDAEHQALLDALDTEFIYYVAALRDLTPRLAGEDQRASLEQWVRRLFSPEYCSESLKERRNRLVCYLACWLGAAVAADDDDGEVLPECPDQGPPPTPRPPPHDAAAYASAAWEEDNQWLHFLRGLPGRVKAKCDQHEGGCPADDADGHWELDQELKLVLHLAAPLRPHLGSAGERQLCGQWLRFLCSATPEDCAALRRRRNQYARVLLGYLHGGELLGPFCEEPPWGQALPALGPEEAAAPAAPTAPEDEFLAALPVPEEGAFCYVVADGVVPVDLHC